MLHGRGRPLRDALGGGRAGHGAARESGSRPRPGPHDRGRGDPPDPRAAASRRGPRRRPRGRTPSPSKAHEGQTRALRRALRHALGRRRPRSSPSSASTRRASAAALLHDVVEDTEVTLEEIEQEFGPPARGDRRRGDQARPPALLLEGGPAGGDGAQDARRDGQGLAGPRHQARRPAAQHADARGHAGVEAAPHRPADPRHLRPARAPPRDPGDQVAARGPLLPGAAPEALRRDRPDGRHPGAAA